MEKTARTSVGVKKKKPRSSNFEWLRIIAMIMIVAHHSIIHDFNIFPLIATGGIRAEWLTFIELGGKVAVMIFFILSGYLMINKDFKISRVKALWKTTWIWSVILFIVTLAVGFMGVASSIGLPPSNTLFTFINAAKNVFPVIMNEYWFITAYILVMIATPVINMILKKVPREKLLLGVVVVAGVYFGLSAWAETVNLQVTFILWNQLVTCVIGYIIGATIKLCDVKFRRRTLLVLLLAAGFGWAVTVINAVNAGTIPMAVSDQASPWAVIFAVIIFMLFSSIKMRPRKSINAVASTVFVVYLISENPNVRYVLWHFCGSSVFYHTYFVYVYPLAIALAVFAVCALLEFGRRGIVRLFMRGYEKHLVRRSEIIS
jgi:hypothetical protein